MRRLTLILLVLAAVLFLVAVNLMKSGIIPLGASRSYSAFKASDYLQPLWAKSCTFDLNDTSNIVVMASVRESGADVQITCWWNRKPIAYSPGAGIALNDSIVRMDESWMDCGKDPDFAMSLREAIYNASKLIYLSERPPRRNMTDYYVLVSKCSTGDGGCGCCAGAPSPTTNGTNVTGVAYALLDMQTKKVYW